MWGSDENLLFAGARCGKLVLSVNWAEVRPLHMAALCFALTTRTKQGTYDWVDGPSLLDTLAVTEEQFVDACIIAGKAVDDDELRFFCYQVLLNQSSRHRSERALSRARLSGRQ